MNDKTQSEHNKSAFGWIATKSLLGGRMMGHRFVRRKNPDSDYEYEY
jgi:hypothetical protein